MALLAAAVVLLAALAVFAMRRGAAANTEDCENKPPPNSFAIPECDDGAAAPGGRAQDPVSTPAPAAP